MKYIRILLIILSTLFIANASTLNISPIISYLLSDTPTFNVTYVEDSGVNTLNPDRGFYDASYVLSVERDYNIFEGVVESGFTLVHSAINLDEYNATAILPNNLIETIGKNLNDANGAGVKLILKINYRADLNVFDPPKDIILGHLEQLKNTLLEYNSVISVVQAGTIGAWGEWHGFTGDFADSDADYIDNRRAIIYKLIDIFPDKYIQIRTPMHKELLYGSSIDYTYESDEGKIRSDTAFTNDIKAKIGHHNDCFLASETDMGTYLSGNIDFWKAYVANDSNYSPVGGETCKNKEVFTTCSNAISEMKKLQYSFVNHAYHPKVIKRWINEGCYDEINENIGYRLVAKGLNIEQNSDALELSLFIENRGYASPYIKSNVNFILKNSDYEYTFENNIDLRTFYSQETKSVESNLTLDDVQSGVYCLYIGIGENNSAIRLSNKDLWEEASKTNKLVCDIILE